MGTSKILIDGVGIDLTEDTVAANKMLSGTKAHDNNGDSITGSIPTYTGTQASGTINLTENGTYNVADYANANVSVPGPLLQSRSVVLGAAAPGTVTPETGYDGLSSVTLSLDSSVIKAENIAKDITMLGITGTHEGGGGGSADCDVQEITFASETEVAGYTFYHNLGRTPVGIGIIAKQTVREGKQNLLAFQTSSQFESRGFGCTYIVWNISTSAWRESMIATSTEYTSDRVKLLTINNGGSLAKFPSGSSYFVIIF